MKEVIIDVREPDEFNAESIKGSVHIPLSRFDSVAPGTLSHFMDHKVIIMCRSGARATMALEQAKKLGFDPKGGYQVYKGGILEWKNQGKPTISLQASHLPIIRQTHIAVGILGLIGMALGHFINPNFYAIAAFAFAGLTIAGLTGLCLMSNIIAMAPWNKHSPTLKEELCLATTGKNNCSK